jgi:hypothetical protein
MTLFNQKRNQLAQYLGVFFTFLSTPALAVDWAWQLESATVFESVIAIQQADGKITRHHFQCDLTDALNEETEMSSTIKTVTPTSHPDGVLVVTCYRGAHAEMIAIVDPSEDKIVYKKIGSYFVDWYLENGKIIIDYDTPCPETKSENKTGEKVKADDTKAQTCTDPNNDFITVSQPWP